jgi:hemerythrin
MTYLQWDESYSVGIASLDAQHQGIMATAERLHSAMLAGRAAEIQQQILREMAEYAAAHFEREERVMATAKFSGLQAHQKLHAGFLEQLRIYGAQAKSHGLPLEMMDFLRGWISEHLRKQDSQYASWIKARNKAPIAQQHSAEPNPCHS